MPKIVSLVHYQCNTTNISLRTALTKKELRELSSSDVPWSAMCTCAMAEKVVCCCLYGRVICEAVVCHQI